MPIFQVFFLFLLLLGVSGPADAQTQDSTGNGINRTAPGHSEAPAAGDAPSEPDALLEKETVAPRSGTLSLYSSGGLVDLPYVYPLLRMRLTPEMRQGMP